MFELFLACAWPVSVRAAANWVAHAGVATGKRQGGDRGDGDSWDGRAWGRDGAGEVGWPPGALDVAGSGWGIIHGACLWPTKIRRRHYAMGVWTVTALRAPFPRRWPHLPSLLPACPALHRRCPRSSTRPGRRTASFRPSPPPAHPRLHPTPRGLDHRLPVCPP